MDFVGKKLRYIVNTGNHSFRLRFYYIVPPINMRVQPLLHFCIFCQKPNSHIFQSCQRNFIRIAVGSEQPKSINVSFYISGKTVKRSKQRIFALFFSVAFIQLSVVSAIPCPSSAGRSCSKSAVYGKLNGRNIRNR